MATDTLAELQKAAKELRDGLKGVDEDIKKLTGRDPSEAPRPGGNRRIQLKRTTFQRGNRQGEPTNKQRRESDGPVNRRWGRTVHMGSRFPMEEERRLDSSGEEDESSKPAIQSVVATEIKPARNPNKVAEEDRQTKSRNRRMFGLLIGTLQKFKDDTEQKSQRERKREEIEKKLEQKAEEEKKEVSSQRRELFQTRKHKQQELRNLERKMENALLKEEVAAHNKSLESFIQLKSKPSIFYLPSKHNDATKKLLEESKSALQELQNARFRDMDLDAEDYGLNSSFNRAAKNGKRFVGRVVDVMDVSHRDLFEEDREEDENEREEANNEKDEEERVDVDKRMDADKGEEVRVEEPKEESNPMSDKPGADSPMGRDVREENVEEVMVSSEINVSLTVDASSVNATEGRDTVSATEENNDDVLKSNELGDREGCVVNNSGTFSTDNNADKSVPEGTEPEQSVEKQERCSQDFPSNNHNSENIQSTLLQTEMANINDSTNIKEETTNKSMPVFQAAHENFVIPGLNLLDDHQEQMNVR